MFKVTIIDLDDNSVELDITTSCIMGAFVDDSKSDEKRICVKCLSFFNGDVADAFVVADSLHGIGEKEKRRCADIVREICTGEEHPDAEV